jgi:outer membrane protein assembly factor BamB
MENQKSTAGTVRILRITALVSGAFAVILSLLILVNFLQVKRADPLNSPALKILVEQLKSTPEDARLQQQVRELDLLARKAFFTNQWQVRAGGYLLFFSLLTVIICLKAIDLMKPVIPDIPGKQEDHFWDERILNRRWVAIAGIFLVAASLVAAWLTHNELGRNLATASVAVGEGKGTPPGSEVTAVSGTTAAVSVTADSAGSAPDSVQGAGMPVMEGYPTQQEIRANFAAFRGYGGNGIDFHKNIPTSWDGKSGKNILWKTEIPLPGYNSPITWNDHVFLSGASDTKREVYCFDAATGKLKWKADAGNIPGSPAQVPKVNSETGHAAPTMATDGRRVYAIFSNGDILALDFAGNRVWAKNLGMPVNHYGHSSSLIMYRDLVIVQYDQRNGQHVMALAGKSGEVVWKTARNVKISWASPILVNTGKRMELILVAEPAMAAYDPATGKELWRIDCIGGEVGPSAAYANGIAFSVNDYSKLAAVELGETPKQLWEDTEYLSDIPSPVATDKYLFLLTSYGMAVCYDARTGTKYWEQDFGTPTYASPMIAEGRVYQMDKNGVMHIFSADKEYKPIAQPQLGEGSVCTPAFGDGRIYIRGNKHLFCVGR